MSNEHNRRPAGYPPQQPHPENPHGYQQGAPDPYQQGYQQQPPQGQTEGWPPQEPQPDWGQAGGQQGYPQGWDAQQPTTQPPQQQAYAPPQPQQGGAYDPYAQQQPAPYQPESYPQQPAGYGDVSYAQTSLNPQQDSAYDSQFEQFPPQGQPAGGQDPAGYQSGYGNAFPQQPQEPQLRGPSFDDVTAPPQQHGYADQGHGQYAPQGYQGGYDQGETQFNPQTGWPEQQGGFPGAGQPSGTGFGGDPYGAGSPQQGWGQEADPYAAQAQPAGYGADAYRQPDPYAGDDRYAYPQQGAPFADQLSPELAAGGQIAATEEYDDDYDDEEDDQPRSGMSRILMVVGALAGAVVIGGGLAYGYKSFVGGDSSSVASKPPVVRGDGVASKARPTDAGGRKFGNADSKVLDRISNQGRGAAGQQDGGPRRVSTVTIGRDGRVVNQGRAPLPSSQPPREPVVSVPGLTVVDGFAGQRQAAQRRQPPAQPQRPITVSPPKTAGSSLSPVRSASVKKVSPPPPRVRQPAPPTTRPTPPRTQQTARATPPAAKPRASVPTTRPAATTPRATGGSGYVAVLASLPVSGSSRLEALKRFADIQQNYGTVLANRTPDVREANLGAKGRYHRLMVGPPASRESAAQLCQRLKSAGYPSCWITAY